MNGRREFIKGLVGAAITPAIPSTHPFTPEIKVRNLSDVDPVELGQWVGQEKSRQIIVEYHRYWVAPRTGPSSLKEPFCLMKFKP